ncbi:two component system sensor histidine kinase [Desulfosarcina variabilis str. Montpellier]|uniref:XrtA/PEP-CTERM system histidine kinase PrsK n=1 Tax=Desulfosarcina variabilis TaxID=2300 RepID=UPI003AFB4216
MIFIIGGFSIILLFSIIVDCRVDQPVRLVYFSILRMLVIIISLAAVYWVVVFGKEFYFIPLLYAAESIFALFWMLLAYRFFQVRKDKKRQNILIELLFLLLSTGVLVTALNTHLTLFAGASIVDKVLLISNPSLSYYSALLMLVSTILMAWQIEAFWRSLDAGGKQGHKYLAIGILLVCAIMGWSGAYRLTYLRLPREHVLLLAVILFLGVAFIAYALVKYRLLNRKLFISRKVVYATLTPLLFAGYFLFVGISALLLKFFDWPVPFVAKWTFVIVGITVICVLALSGSIRRKVRFFISTNFYVNKYEYRDEWLAFSSLLQDKLTEKGVIEALHQILKDCLYTQRILIWSGDTQNGFKLIHHGKQPVDANAILAGDDSLICYLQNNPHLYVQDDHGDAIYQTILSERESFFQSHGIVLLVPLVLGSQFVGLVGLGEETTGGRYGHDDFDLLMALGSHAASALLAVRNAEKLAKTREQSAYIKLSAFILHDIKNAAAMLDLVRANAPRHMANPEFQQDMLETIDDALKRMVKVQNRLSVLKNETIPNFKSTNLYILLDSICKKLTKKNGKLEINVKYFDSVAVHTDPEFIERIIENLVLNANQAGATSVNVTATVNEKIKISIADNGVGINEDLLPYALFESFKTGKPAGSGIGLWQARQLVEALGGDIQALNSPDGGALFVLLLPLEKEL